MTYCPYQDLTRDVRSNIPLRLQEFPWASPSGTLSGIGIYLTVYPSSRPITDTVCSFCRMFFFIFRTTSHMCTNPLPLLNPKATGSQIKVQNQFFFFFFFQNCRIFCRCFQLQSTHTISKKKCINLEYQEKISIGYIFIIQI